MGKYFGLVVIGALLLTGCASGEPTAAPSASATETADAQVQTRSIEVSDATPEASPAEAVDEDLDSAYLAFLKPTWRTEIPSDDDLLAAAVIACDELRAGKQTYELDIITGGTPENNAWHSSQVGVAAVSTFCPDADVQL